MKMKRAKEMRLGVFGLDRKSVEKLREMFLEVETVNLSRLEPYDALFFDLTFATNHTYQYIAKQSPIPLIVYSSYDENYKKLRFLTDDSYIVLGLNTIFKRDEFVKLFEAYLERFKYGVGNYRIYYELVPGCLREEKVKEEKALFFSEEAKEEIENGLQEWNKAREILNNSWGQATCPRPEKVEVIDPNVFATKENKKEEIWKEWMVKKGKLDRKELQVFKIYD